MNLLPKSHEKFSDVNYWDTFFKKRGQKSFEWYGEYPELCGYLFKYIKIKDDVLVVGCGNSNLSMEMYDVGYKKLSNIDISQVAIKQMKAMNKLTRPDLSFEQMDATQMTFPDESFNVVLDKGTLDALMPDNKEETVKTINKYFSEIKRVLRNGGRYICISLLQEHIMKKLIEDFPSAGFMFRVVRCHEAEIKAKEEDESSLPVFILVATKFNKLVQPVFEIAMNENENPIRVSSKEEVIEAIASVQESALICHGLHRGSIADIGEVSIDLYQKDNKHPRFTIFIVDRPSGKKSGRTYASFIVPQGRENDWLFSTKEGRQQLLTNTQYERLAVVILRREHTFENMQSVQSEISGSIKSFAPGDLSNSVIPFLTLGNDVGKREIVYEGHSEMSGPFVIEDVEDECGTHRKIIFLSNPFVTQSESRLKLTKSRRGKSKKVIDYGFLSCFHHVYMSVAVNAAIKDKESSSVLVVGLGGGALCSFLHRCFPKLKVTAVDIDETMLKVAKEYFGLTLDERLNVEINDGIKYLESCSTVGKKFDAILFDVDNKDTSVGMSCPPKEFLDPSTLNWVGGCLADNGLFVLNLVVRNKSLRPEILAELKQVFEFCASYPLQEHVNEIIVCSKQLHDEKQWKSLNESAATSLNEQVEKTKLLNRQMVDVAELVFAMKIE